MLHVIKPLANAGGVIMQKFSRGGWVKLPKCKTDAIIMDKNYLCGGSNV